MKNGVHLQGFKGYFEGTKAIDIKVGDVLVTRTIHGNVEYDMLRRN